MYTECSDNIQTSNREEGGRERVIVHTTGLREEEEAKVSALHRTTQSTHDGRYVLKDSVW